MSKDNENHKFPIKEFINQVIFILLKNAPPSSGFKRVIEGHSMYINIIFNCIQVPNFVLIDCLDEGWSGSKRWQKKNEILFQFYLILTANKNLNLKL